MANPSNHQLERHIRQSSAESSNVAFVKHAWDQMRARHVNQAMVMEVLRTGHFVSGMNVAVVVAVEHPEPGLTVITVIDLLRS